MNTVRPSTTPDIANRTTGKVLVILHEVCELPLAQCWRIGARTSTSTGNAAEVQASKPL